MNGDGIVMKSEVITFLSYRSIGSPYLANNLKLWCQTVQPDSFCYEETAAQDTFADASVMLEDVYKDAVDNFVSSLKHTFGKFYRLVY